MRERAWGRCPCGREGVHHQPLIAKSVETHPADSVADLFLAPPLGFRFTLHTLMLTSLELADLLTGLLCVGREVGQQPLVFAVLWSRAKRPLEPATHPEPTTSWAVKLASVSVVKFSLPGVPAARRVWAGDDARFAGHPHVHPLLNRECHISPDRTNPQQTTPRRTAPAPCLAPCSPRRSRVLSHTRIGIDCVAGVMQQGRVPEASLRASAESACPPAYQSG